MTEATFEYGGALALRAHVVFPSDGQDLPIIILMHGFGGSGEHISTATRSRYAGYGAFVLVVEMRGRGGSGGTPDLGGLEIQDIVDAVDYVKANYAAQVDAEQVHIVGYSGGGGNALSCITKFPDSFNSAVSFFGIGDYAAWYPVAGAERQASMDAWVGGSPAAMPDHYTARKSLDAIPNYSGGFLSLFHDTADGIVPVTQSDAVRDALDAAAMTNYAYSRSQPGDALRWQHAYPDQQPDLIVAEDQFIPALVAKSHPVWTVPASGTLQVAGYLDTKRFRVALGALDDEAGAITYDSATREFTIVCTTGAATYHLTLKGQTPSSPVQATIDGTVHTETADSNGNVVYTGSTNPMAASDALIVVRPNTAFRLYLPMQKNDGTLVEVAWSSPTITVNKDAATSSIADSPHQIGTTAWGYVDFTGVEIGTSKVITGYWKVTNTHAIPTPFALIVVADSEIPVNVKAIGDGLLTAAKFASDFFTGVAQGVWAYATASATVVGSMGKALVDFITYATTKLGLITAGAVNFTAPVEPSTLALTIVRGDDYSDDSGRTLPTWESDDWSVLDLSAAASVTFKAKTRYGTTIFSKAMGVLSDTEVQLQLTDAETAAFDAGTNAYRYDIEAVLGVAKSGDIVTLAQGTMSVLADVR